MLLTRKVLVLSAQGLDSIVSLLDLGPQFVDLGRIAARLGLRVLQLLLQVGHLALPFINGLVEATLSLLGL